jgi:hypothetical protein
MNQWLLWLRYVVIGSGRYALNSLKNWVGLLVGRKPRADERMLFFRQYILHLTGLRRIRAVTCAEHSDREGAGFQAHMMMNAINFARATGLTYVHTPFSSIGHADRPMEQWVAAWEHLFNLGAGEEVWDGKRRDVVNYRYVADDLEVCFGWSERREELTQHFKALISEFRRKYYGSNPPRRTEEVTVAVHVRRGDVPALNEELFTSMESVARTVRAVKSSLERRGVEYRIRVYSQGRAPDFAELTALGAYLFLDADAIWTVQELIEADVLVMAKGSFSYCAGILSDGIKLFESMAVAGSHVGYMASWGWTVLFPSEDWIPRRDGGFLDEAAFERQLDLLFAGR